MFDFLPPESLPFSVDVVHETIVSPQKHLGLLTWLTPLSSIAEKHLETRKSKELDENWNLNEFFEIIYVINLPQEKERLKKVSQELKEIGVSSFNIFKAIDGRKEVDPSIWNKFYLNLHDVDKNSEDGRAALDRLHQGQAGCYLSHYYLIKQIDQHFKEALKQLDIANKQADQEAIKIAKKLVKKYSRVLIFEDDIGFGILSKKGDSVSKNGVGKILRKALKKLPKDWDLLYLMVHASQPTSKASTHLRKIKRSWYQCAYAINHTMYQPILERLRKIEDPAVHKVLPVDAEIAEIHYKHQVYAIYPSIVFTQEGKSYITGINWKKREQPQPIFPLPKN